MAQQYNTRIAHISDGVQTEFSFPFDVTVARKLLVLVDGVEKTEVDDYTVDAVAHTIDFLVAPTNGQDVVLVRETPVWDATYEFGTDTVLTSTNLMENFEQLLGVTQELSDRVIELEAIVDTLIP